MFKKLGLSLIIGLQIIVVSGCWDYRDIDTVNFPLTASYDLHEETKTAASKQDQEEQMVDLTTILPNLDPSVKPNFRIEKTAGMTIAVARGLKPYAAPGKYSPAVATVIVIGEDLANTGLNNIFEALYRGPQTPNTQNLAIAEGRGESIMNAPVEDYPNMGDFLRGLLQQSDKRSFIPANTLNQFEDSQAPGKNPIMPLLKAKDKQAEVVGAAIFKKDRMIAKVNLDATRSLMMLRGIESTGNMPFIIKGDGYILDKGSVNLTNSRKVKVERSGDDYTFQITIMLQGNLVEHQFGISFTENKELQKMIEDQIASDVQDDCNLFIRKMQDQYKIDCIDISKYALAKWEKDLLDRIDKDFIENVNIKVDVKMKLKNIGELT